MWPLFDLEVEYRKHPAIKREDVQKILKWVDAQPHMPKLWEQEILLFYNACGMQTEYTKQVIDAYYTFRTHTEELFGDLDVNSPQMQLALKTSPGFPLNERTKEGYGIVIGKIMDPNPANFDFAASEKIVCAALDMWLHNTGLIPGIMVVFDLENMAFGHMARMNVLLMKKLFYFFQETIPVRLVCVHFINPPSIMEKLMSLMNPFIKKELKDAFIVHPNLESFYKYIPRNILPKDFGGDSGSCSELMETFNEQLLSNRSNIIEFNNSRRVNEKLRPEKTKSHINNLGTQGNFKKLDID
uniref:CRAL-TRIO domain-containing protein n=1 Tax=Stomoxys calcitrans TaxID=35570 RepID=A0A1I8Q407_STOCA